MAVSKVVYGNTTLIDLTNDTVASNKMLQGTTAHGADGSAITGSIVNKGVINAIIDATDSNYRYTLNSGYYENGSVYVIREQKTVTPSASSFVVTPENGHVLSQVTVNAIDSSYVGSNIIRRSSTDLSASGSVVTVPSGYYAAAASKTVTAGSATTPTTTITANPAITLNTATGVVSAAAAASKSITPTVASGYISSGNAGVVTVSGSSNFQLSTKAAATYIPTTTDQTIAAGQYLTGVQTIKGDPKLISENIVFDESIFGVQGSFGTDFIVVGNYGLYFKNFDINNNVLISEKGTVTGNTLVLT